MDESTLPEPIQRALSVLRATIMPEARADAVHDNWVYVWLPQVHVEEAKFPPPNERGLWVRIPMQFPFAQPHGIVTKEPLVPTDGHAVKGHNAGHEMCNPVGPIGGGHYYSWTWSGELGQGPALRSADDILEVVNWVERRIRLA